jgi:hypothetical protein
VFIDLTPRASERVVNEQIAVGWLWKSSGEKWRLRRERKKKKRAVRKRGGMMNSAGQRFMFLDNDSCLFFPTRNIVGDLVMTEEVRCAKRGGSCLRDVLRGSATS